MSVGPGDPGRDLGNGGVVHNEVYGERGDGHDVDSSDGHETEVSVRADVVSGQKLLELRTSLHECPNAQDGVNRGDQSNDNRPDRDKNECGRSVPGVLVAANVFVDVESVTRNNIFCKQCKLLGLGRTNGITYDKPSPG